MDQGRWRQILSDHRLWRVVDVRQQQAQGPGLEIDCHARRCHGQSYLEPAHRRAADLHRGGPGSDVLRHTLQGLVRGTCRPGRGTDDHADGPARVGAVCERSGTQNQPERAARKAFGAGYGTAMGAHHDQGQAEPEVNARLRRFSAAAEPYLYIAPVLLLILAVMLVPLAVGLSYAFRDLLLLDPSGGHFIGLDHFQELADDPIFRDSLGNTVIWTGASVGLQFVLGLILALLLNREFPARRLVQALVFLPWAVPTFLVGLAWAWLFNPVIGPLPHWLFALHLAHDANSLLADAHWALIGPIVAAVWWGIPFFAITTLAALQSN